MSILDRYDEYTFDNGLTVHVGDHVVADVDGVGKVRGTVAAISNPKAVDWPITVKPHTGGLVFILPTEIKEISR